MAAVLLVLAALAAAQPANLGRVNYFSRRVTYRTNGPFEKSVAVELAVAGPLAAEEYRVFFHYRFAESVVPALRIAFYRDSPTAQWVELPEGCLLPVLDDSLGAEVLPNLCRAARENGAASAKAFGSAWFARNSLAIVDESLGFAVDTARLHTQLEGLEPTAAARVLDRLKGEAAGSLREAMYCFLAGLGCDSELPLDLCFKQGFVARLKQLLALFFSALDAAAG